MRRRHPTVPFAIGPAFALALAACLPATAPVPPPIAGPSAPPPAVSSSAAPIAATPVASTGATSAPTPSAPGAPPATPAPTAPSAGPPTPRPLLARHLQAAVDGFRVAAGVPGVAVTIVFPDGTAWTGVSGYADVAAKEPVRPDTAFSVASVSKTFLAALVLELSGEGAFRLEDQVRRHLPEVGLDPGITVRMLLDHTSGLHDFFLHPRIDRALVAEPSRGWSPTRTLGYVGKPYFKPGTGWHYSNTNYLLLGLLVERVTGRSVAEELRARFFDPMRLETAFYQSAEPARGPLARGYRLTGRGSNTVATDLSDGSGIVPFRSVVTASAGAGSVAASSRDIALWARALYGGDAIDPESLSIMLSGIDHVAAHQPRVPYGLGVQAVLVGEHRTFGHSGRFAGFRSAMRWLPDEGLAIAVLTNQSRADPGALAARLLEIALPEPGTVPAPQPR